MSRVRNPVCILLLALISCVVTTAGPLVAVTDEDEEIRVEKIHKIVVDCDEGTAEDCERQIRIETIGDGAQVVHVGDHAMTWVTEGEHGSHFSFGPMHFEEGAFLGVQLTDLTPELRIHFGVAADEGVMVAKVVDDSPAFRAGLAAGDIITRLDGHPMLSGTALAHAIRGRDEGDIVDLEVWRDGSVESFQATLDKRQPAGALHRSIMIDCGDDEADCAAHFHGGFHHAMAVDCPEGEDCAVEIDCSDGDCDCTLNGDSIDCADLHAAHDSGD